MAARRPHLPGASRAESPVTLRPCGKPGRCRFGCGGGCFAAATIGPHSYPPTAGAERALLGCLIAEDTHTLTFACAALQNLCHEAAWSEIVMAHGAQARHAPPATPSLAAESCLSPWRLRGGWKSWCAMQTRWWCGMLRELSRTCRQLEDSAPAFPCVAFLPLADSEQPGHPFLASHPPPLVYPPLLRLPPLAHLPPSPRLP